MNVNLVLFKKNGARKSFHLASAVTVIGRRQECDLCIPLMVISRKHCQITYAGNEVRLRDMGSRNGTMLNGQRIEEAQLNPGDEIEIGPLRFGVQINGSPADLGAGDESILQPPEHLAASSKYVEDHADEFASDAEEDADMNQTYGATEILNGIDENLKE